MERALILAERGRGRTSPNPMVGALIVSPDGIVVGRGFHERAGTPHAEVHAIADARRSRARRDAVLHAGTVLSHRTHRAVHARGRARGHRARGGGRHRSESGGRGRRHPLSARSRHRRDGRRARRSRRAPQRRVLHQRDEAAAVRHAEDRDEPRRTHRRRARRAHGADVRGREPSRAAAARRSGCDRGRLRNRAGRRSAADGARRVSLAAADARHLRQSLAHAADGADLHDARRRADHRRHLEKCRAGEIVRS